MNSFERKLITEWRKLNLPVRGENIVVAISGGADSLGLLLAIAELTRKGKLEHRLIAAHLNHSLRGKASDEDEKFVRAVAREHEIELVVKKSRIASRGNLEQNSRRVRYAFLSQVAQKYAARFVLTAHTINDQAETLLLNLIRGSGVEGLSGMKPIRTFGFDGETVSKKSSGNISIVRPLLTWATRTETENYCHHRGTRYCIDQMNLDMKFSRVKIRCEVIPLLMKLNPQIVNTLSRTAATLGESVLNGAAGKASVSPTLQISVLKSLDRGERIRTLRIWLQKQRGSLRQIGAKHLDAIDRLILSTKSGRAVEIPKQSVVVKRKGILELTTIKVEKNVSEN